MEEPNNHRPLSAQRSTDNPSSSSAQPSQHLQSSRSQSPDELGPGEPPARHSFHSYDGAQRSDVYQPHHASPYPSSSHSIQPQPPTLPFQSSSSFDRQPYSYLPPPTGYQAGSYGHPPQVYGATYGSGIGPNGPHQPLQMPYHSTSHYQPPPPTSSFAYPAQPSYPYHQPYPPRRDSPDQANHSPAESLSDQPHSTDKRRLSASSASSRPNEVTGPAVKAKPTTKKRKSTVKKDEGEDGGEEGAEKRNKTGRACDVCRGKKTRCDILPDIEPQICRYCKNAGLSCTFHLPISETRFKKKRQQKDDEAAAAATTLLMAKGGSTPSGGKRARQEESSEYGAKDGDGRAKAGKTSRVSEGSGRDASGGVADGGIGHIGGSDSRTVKDSVSRPDITSVISTRDAKGKGRVEPDEPLHSFSEGREKGGHGHPGSPVAGPGMGLVPMVGAATPGSSSSGTVGREERANMRVQGPTSVSFLLHSTASLPTQTFAAYDLRHNTSFEVSASGDGLIKIYSTLPSASPSLSSPNVDGGGSPVFALPPAIEQLLPHSVIQQLVNIYFEDVAPLFPVISRKEFLEERKPSPLLLYSIAGVAATRRDVPRDVFNALRTAINGIIKSNEVLSDSSLQNIQSLLILSTVGDLHAQPHSTALSAASMRLSVAIRMAQDLGLHRDEISKNDPVHLELRRRIWAGCVIMDRWYAASLGFPLIIDLLDCDVLLPSPYGSPEEVVFLSGGEERPYLYMSELLKLSILLGRITKMIYGPTGLKTANDAALESLLFDMRQWKKDLPFPLHFHGLDSSFQAGLLHLYYTTLTFLFFRVFMRISYQCPSHLRFSLDVETWSELQMWSRETIDWLELHSSAMDTLFMSSYSCVSVALVQFHSWARRSDSSALDALRKLKAVGVSWELAVQPDHMSIRRKTIEVMSLLYDAAQNVHFVSNPMPEPGRLNPTKGVHNNRPPLDGLLKWQDDASRPGGGVFVAEPHIKAHFAQEGLAEGTIVRPGSSGLGGRSRSSAPNFNPSIGGNIFQIQPEMSGAVGGFTGEPRGFSDPNPIPFQHISPPPLQPANSHVETPAPTEDHSLGSPSYLNDYTLLGGVAGGEGADDQQALLEGLPGTLMDWNSWDDFFSRFDIPTDPSPAAFPPRTGSS